jgi:hypothetical protein
VIWEETEKGWTHVKVARERLRGHEAVTLDKEHEARRPRIAADGKAGLHACFLSADKGSKVPDVFYVRSPDGGKTWDARVNVSKTPGMSSDPAIACGPGGVVAIVWVDTTSGIERPDIFCASSSDRGQTWSKPANVSDTPAKSYDPAIAISPDGTFHVVWVDTNQEGEAPDIWYAQSTDKGATWSKAKNVSRTPGVSSQPAIACGPKGEIYVCWVDTAAADALPDIFFCASTDGGKTFGDPVDASETPHISATPDIAADANGIYLAWADNSTGASSWNIFFSASRDGGKTWEHPLNVAPTPGQSTEPALAVDEGRIAVVWRDTTWREWCPDIWLAVSNDHGKSFGAPSDLSSTDGVSKHPDVAIAAGHVCALWEEDEKGSTRVKLARQSLR